MTNPTKQSPALSAEFNFADHLFGCNQHRASKLAYIDDVAGLTYKALEQKAKATAAMLLDAGIRQDERILLLMHDCNDWPISFLGALHAGIVPVAVNTLLTANDYAFMLQNSRSQAVLISKPLLPALLDGLKISDAKVKQIFVSTADSADLQTGGATLPDSCTWLAKKRDEYHGAAMNILPTHCDDPAFWLYSSGSTGKPKGTIHSHANAFHTTELYGKAVLGLTENDVCFSAAKLFFAYGLGNALSFPLSVGATTILMAERPTPDACFARLTGSTEPLVALNKPKPTVFFGAPTGFAGMLASPNLPAASDTSLRFASSAGEALPAEIGTQFTAKFNIPIVDGIGSTEMLHIFLSNFPDRYQYGTTGWPVPGYEIELRGDDGAQVPDGEPGDLYIKGPTAALMYWRNREKSRETFQGAWTKSGDKYIRNNDGSFTYSGRSDDMLKVSGVYVSPFEIEATLIQHPSVLEAAVIGVTDEQGLTKTKAFVVLKPGASATDTELKAFTKDRLAAYKYPRSIEFIAELPKTATGKIQRFRLREQQSLAK